MEDALAPFDLSRIFTEMIVLILVLMEDALALVKLYNLTKKKWES